MKTLQLKLYVLLVLTLLWASLVQAQFDFTQDPTAVYLPQRQKAAVALALKLFATPADQRAGLLTLYRPQFTAIFNSEPTEVKVQSFGQYLDLLRGEALFSDANLTSLSVEELLEALRPVKYKSDTASVQNRIDRYENETRVVREQLQRQFIQVATEYLSSGQQISTDGFENYIKDSISQQIDQFQGDLNTLNSENVRLLSKLLKLYFKYIPNEHKAQILLKLLELPVNPKPLDIFQVMISHAGPQMQKLVQIVGRHQEIPAEFQVVFQRLESQVPRVPWKQVEQLLQEEGVDLSKYTYFERRPIGVGTMAQTHRAQYMNEQGQRVSSVVRFLKPDIERMVEMDNQILLQIAAEIENDPELKELRIPSIRKIIADLHSSIVEELKIADTVRNQQEARETYNYRDRVTFSRHTNTLDFYVPTTRLFGRNNRLMEQELVNGSKVSTVSRDYQDVFPDLYKAVAEKIAEHWFDTVMFKSGFFHADLHQGNILMSYSDAGIKVYLLDFGMVGRLTQQQRESALLLALAIKLNHPDVIAKHLNRLSENVRTGAQYDEFLNQVKARAEELSRHPQAENSMDSWVIWSLEKGVVLHYDFLKLNRGLTAITTMLSDAKSDMNLNSIAERRAMQNKVQVTRILMRENLLRLRDYATLVGWGSQAVAGGVATSVTSTVRGERAPSRRANVTTGVVTGEPAATRSDRTTPRRAGVSGGVRCEALLAQ